MWPVRVDGDSHQNAVLCPMETNNKPPYYSPAAWAAGDPRTTDGCECALSCRMWAAISRSTPTRWKTGAECVMATAPPARLWRRRLRRARGWVHCRSMGRGGGGGRAPLRRSAGGRWCGTGWDEARLCLVGYWTEGNRKLMLHFINMHARWYTMTYNLNGNFIPGNKWGKKALVWKCGEKKVLECIMVLQDVFLWFWRIN